MTANPLHEAAGIVALHAFGAPDAAAVRALTASVRATGHGDLALRFCLDADMRQLDIPVAVAPGPADELWRQTCFEAFVAAADEPAYREFNFSPSGQWAVYAFSAYRERNASFAAAAVPRIRVERSDGRLLLEALLPRALLPPAGGGPLRIGLAAVIRHAGGALEYRALRHPGARPDFHHRDGFVLSLQPQSTEHRDG